ncbi:MAG: hypothetical protein SGI90_10330 [Candidatus Eisenbacteria bacterium]|nr:hypothetical protein [Candidatus Eisenbacteria bacterium]
MTRHAVRAVSLIVGLLVGLLASGGRAEPTRPILQVPPDQPLGIPSTHPADSTDVGTEGTHFAVLPDEPHLANIRQLTRGGENAEAYFSFDGDRLTLQSSRPPYACDQIFVMDIPAKDAGREFAGRLVSTGMGRTTCSYFFPDGKSILYSSTHGGGAECPPKPSFERGYVWPLYPSYDIYQAGLDGRIQKPLTASLGYDAEATISPDGKTIVFTSDRDGDLELYSMSLDGQNVKRLTNKPGYDGGAFFSPDSKLICYRAHHPTDPAELAEYRSLLAENLIKPGVLDLMVMNRDGGNQQVVFSNGKANFAPFFHPSGKKLIFASNLADPKGRNFDLYLVNLDGTGLDRVTFNETFDGFPMFSPDGTKLVFASNRNAEAPGETNIFLADWVE